MHDPRSTPESLATGALGTQALGYTGPGDRHFDDGSRLPGMNTYSSEPLAHRSAAARSRSSRRVSNSRLMAVLALWDALIPAALVTATSQSSGTFGQRLNGGAAGIDDRLVLLLAVLSPIGLAMAGGYHQRRRRGGSRLLFALRLAVVGMTVSWIALITSAAADWPIDFAQMLALSVFMPIGWLIGRWACDRHPCTGPERVLLVGSGLVAQKVLELTTRHRERRLTIVGRIDGDTPDSEVADGPPLLGDLPDLPDVLATHGIDRVIVAFTPGRDSELLELLRRCVSDGVQVDIVPRFYELLGASPRASSVGALAMMEVPARGLSAAQRTTKRALDVVGSLALLIALAPVMGLTAIAIGMTDGRPILFRQARVGRQGRTFSILKFRTMSGEGSASEAGAVAGGADMGEDHEDGAAAFEDLVRHVKTDSLARVTRIGTFLRKSSIDELPQLINVLRGEMSLVGPRPLRPFEVASLSQWQLARQDLRPGLTGLWQVLGRSEIDWSERMQLDYAYVAHWSFAEDMRILARTLPAVATKDGAV